MRLLILGAGQMARRHVAAFGAAEGCSIVAAVDPDASRLNAFADRHGIPNRFSSLDEAISWGGFDSAANVTPDRVHHPTTMRLIEAGKNVFCEKPLATEYALAREMADAAVAGGIINMVNLTYRGAASVHSAREVVMSGELGELRHFEASYLQSWLVGRHWGDWTVEDRWLWRLSSRHGSKGTVGDIGIHIVDFLTYAAASDIVALSSLVKTFHKSAGDRIGEYIFDVNDSFVVTAELQNGAIGTIHASRWASGNDNELRVGLYGTRGGIKITADEDRWSLQICSGSDVHSLKWQTIALPPVPSTYAEFVTAVRTGANRQPDFRRAADLQKVLDTILAAGESAGALIRIA
jgi:predicted dehydrogenase